MDHGGHYKYNGLLHSASLPHSPSAGGPWPWPCHPIGPPLSRPLHPLLRPQGIMTYRNAALFNLPNDPSQYPAGLLTIIPWYLVPMGSTR